MVRENNKKLVNFQLGFFFFFFLGKNLKSEGKKRNSLNLIKTKQQNHSKPNRAPHNGSDVSKAFPGLGGTRRNKKSQLKPRGKKRNTKVIYH